MSRGHSETGNGLRTAVLVLSDKGARGERQDLSGPSLLEFLAERGVPDALLEVLPDERELIAGRGSLGNDDFIASLLPAMA